MDSLRVFTTFKSTGSGQKLRPRKPQGTGESAGQKAIMRERSLDEKPSMSRSEVLAKLEKSKAPSEASEKKEVKGKRFGDGFMDPSKIPAKILVPKEAKESQGKAGAADGDVVGDIGKNNPADSMTTEKLKSMLNSNVVNFSGKEKEILSKILG